MFASYVLAVRWLLALALCSELAAKNSLAYYYMMRALFQSDIDQLLRIEKSVHVTPWTEETFKACFQAGYLGWLIEIDKKVAGFIIVSVSLEECHVLNLCVSRPFQRQGWGRKLLEHALVYARQTGTQIAYLEVRRSNQAAISLYRNMKFQLVGERKAYYPTVAGNEDALIFAIDLRAYTPVCRPT
jgi:ribosomal-protein-alanine N-acetyltransferase